MKNNRNNRKKLKMLRKRFWVLNPDGIKITGFHDMDKETAMVTYSYVSPTKIRVCKTTAIAGFVFNT